MNNDLISRSALKKAISDNGYSHYFEIFDIIDNAPTVEPETKLVANVTFNKEQMKELVEKAKADILEQIERPQGECKCVTCKYRSCEITEKPCRECCRAWTDLYEEAEMKGGAE